MEERNVGEKQPLVSIVTPSYNQGRFIEDTILSVKNQNYPNIEHIIIDGGSTDNTLDILKRYEGTYNMLWISEPDEGQADAVNKGFEMARGEIVGWLNSDDCYLTKDVFTEVVNSFKANPNSQIVYGDIAEINETNQLILVCSSVPLFSYSLMRRLNCLLQPTVFFLRDIVQEEKLNKELNYCMDYNYWLRIGKKYNFHYLDKIVAAFRLHDKSKTISNKEKMREEEKFVRKNFGGKDNSYLIFLSRFLKIKALHKAISLYSYPVSYFAFNVRLIDKRTLIIRQIIPGFILNKRVKSYKISG